MIRALGAVVKGVFVITKVAIRHPVSRVLTRTLSRRCVLLSCLTGFESSSTVVQEFDSRERNKCTRIEFHSNFASPGTTRREKATAPSLLHAHFDPPSKLPVPSLAISGFHRSEKVPLWKGWRKRCVKNTDRIFETLQPEARPSLIQNRSSSCTL